VVVVVNGDGNDLSRDTHKLARRFQPAEADQSVNADVDAPRA